MSLYQHNTRSDGFASLLLLPYLRLVTWQQIKHLQKQQVVLDSKINRFSFVVLDAIQLSLHLKTFQQLVRRKVAVFIVPQAVIQHLDALKSGVETINKGARAATKFLLEQQQQGSVWIRVQRPEEKAPHSLDEDCEASSQIAQSIVSCAVHFANHAAKQTLGPVGVATAEPDTIAMCKTVQLTCTSPPKLLSMFKSRP
eukprot:m.103479 g.103479  ORF g.103479 m.103479 type:complete len:198 (-) comp13241_c0_seq3:201-794(-)